MRRKGAMTRTMRRRRWAMGGKEQEGWHEERAWRRVARRRPTSRNDGATCAARLPCISQTVTQVSATNLHCNVPAAACVHFAKSHANERYIIQAFNFPAAATVQV